MSKSKRLVYLPDPTIKFYFDPYEFTHCFIKNKTSALEYLNKENICLYSDNDLDIYNLKQKIEIKIINQIDKAKVLDRLKEIFKENDLNMTNDIDGHYFMGLLNRIELYEVMEI